MASLNPLDKKLNANTEKMFAPSVAEADAILESFGFVDSDALLAA